MFKVQSYEEGNLEIHHSDRSGHLDRHRHQPGSHQLHLLRGEPTPNPSQKEGGLRRKRMIARPLLIYKTTSYSYKIILKILGILRNYSYLCNHVYKSGNINSKGIRLRIK